jgi:alpha-tubulin suppressor-like RCC1 family protein
VQVAAGGLHTLALHTDGRLVAWGINTYGQLGPGAPINQRGHPQLVRVPGHYVQLAAGDQFSLALTANGQLYAWGENRSGQLGPGRRATRPLQPDPHSPDATPVLVPGQWASVAAGGDFVLALTPAGRLFAWGSNLRGQLGPNAPVDDVPHPEPVPVPGRYSQVAAGLNFSLALTPEGQLYVWGDNFTGQLATPVNSWQSTQLEQPPAMPTPRRLPGQWASVAAGGDFVLALRADGQLWAWGGNIKGQIGRSPNTDSPVPAPLPGRYVRVSTRRQHCLALGSDGQLYAWGENGTGQLGSGTKQGYFNDEDHPVPTVTP